MTRYFIKLAYDGTRYCGWQAQPNVDTVQETIESALRIFAKDLGRIVGCGRTDAGVHAREYFAHFDTEASLPDNLVYKLNAILPMDIAIYDCFAVAPEMHARFSVSSRTYRYYIHHRKDPFSNAFSVYYNDAMDVEMLNAACQCLIGEHDFMSFSRVQTDVKHHHCKVSHASWQLVPGGAVFTVTANRFLRNMVRALVGTMLKMNSLKLDPQYLAEVLAAQNREAAGKSAYPQGLFLYTIIYPNLK